MRIAHIASLLFWCDRGILGSIHPLLKASNYKYVVKKSFASDSGNSTESSEIQSSSESDSIATGVHVPKAADMIRLDRLEYERYELTNGLRVIGIGRLVDSDRTHICIYFPCGYMDVPKGYSVECPFIACHIFNIFFHVQGAEIMRQTRYKYRSDVYAHTTRVVIDTNKSNINSVLAAIDRAMTALAITESEYDKILCGAFCQLFAKFNSQKNTGRICCMDSVNERAILVKLMNSVPLTLDERVLGSKFYKNLNQTKMLAFYYDYFMKPHSMRIIIQGPLNNLPEETPNSYLNARIGQKIPPATKCLQRPVCNNTSLQQSEYDRPCYVKIIGSPLLSHLVLVFVPERFHVKTFHEFRIFRTVIHLLCANPQKFLYRFLKAQKYIDHIVVDYSDTTIRNPPIVIDCILTDLKTSSVENILSGIQYYFEYITDEELSEWQADISSTLQREQGYILTAVKHNNPNSMVMYAFGIDELDSVLSADFSETSSIAELIKKMFKRSNITLGGSVLWARNKTGSHDTLRLYECTNLLENSQANLIQQFRASRAAPPLQRNENSIASTFKKLACLSVYCKIEKSIAEASRIRYSANPKKLIKEADRIGYLCKQDTSNQNKPIRYSIFYYHNETDYKTFALNKIYIDAVFDTFSKIHQSNSSVVIKHEYNPFSIYSVLHIEASLVDVKPLLIELSNNLKNKHALSCSDIDNAKERFHFAVKAYFRAPTLRVEDALYTPDFINNAWLITLAFDEANLLKIGNQSPQSKSCLPAGNFIFQQSSLYRGNYSVIYDHFMHTVAPMNNTHLSHLYFMLLDYMEFAGEGSHACDLFALNTNNLSSIIKRYDGICYPINCMRVCIVWDTLNTPAEKLAHEYLLLMLKYYLNAYNTNYSAVFLSSTYAHHGHYALISLSVEKLGPSTLLRKFTHSIIRNFATNIIDKLYELIGGLRTCNKQPIKAMQEALADIYKAFRQHQRIMAMHRRTKS